MAIRAIVDGVHTAWSRKACASLLQLDITGAFDRVDWNWLFTTLRDLRFERKLIFWLISYIYRRTAQLLFDSGLSAPQDITQGIPQGSPLLAILFILFISTLYEKLKHIKGLITLSFTDDINL